MTLKDFLIKSNRADLDVNDVVTNHIRLYVQNIDALASKELCDIPRDDLRDIYMAILLYKSHGRVVFHTQAWNEFLKDAKKVNLSNNVIMSIYNRERN